MTKTALSYDGGWALLKKAATAIAEKWDVGVSISDKNGHLNIDWSDPKGKFEGILHEIGQAIELASEATCQYCGSRSYVKQTDPPGYIYTLCGECRKMVEAPKGPEHDRLEAEALKRYNDEFITYKKYLSGAEIPG